VQILLQKRLTTGEVDDSNADALENLELLNTLRG
jgi:hypothetical protein